MVSRYVVDGTVIVGLACTLMGLVVLAESMIDDDDEDPDPIPLKLRRCLSVALAFWMVGLVGVGVGSLSNVQWIQVALLVVGFAVSALTPRIIKVGNLVSRQWRIVATTFIVLGIAAQFLPHLFGIKVA